jgi:quercetin dioxygenase-like cupin family protein
MARQDSAPSYFVNQQSVAPYHPANHTGTTNYRLIGPETVGANHIEVVLVVVEKSKGALSHSHPGIDQVCYLLEGPARAEVGGQARFRC